MVQINILGCGWLGLPLAQKLIKAGFGVKGSTTTDGRIEGLKQAAIDPFLISLTSNAIGGDIAGFLNKSEILIIGIPPKLRGEHKESFTDKIQRLIPYIEASGIQKVIFVSSTSVYADDNTIVTEETLPEPETESGRQLLASEKILQQNLHFKTTVIRFAGLIGEDRHPVYSLSSKTGLENPEAPVNLIHQNDCIGIICALIEKDIWGETFNAAASYHPAKRDYYTLKAKQLGLAVPGFNISNKPYAGKIISSNKLKSILGYSFSEGIL